MTTSLHFSYFKPIAEAIWNYDFPKSGCAVKTMVTTRPVCGGGCLLINPPRYGGGFRIVPGRCGGAPCHASSLPAASL